MIDLPANLGVKPRHGGHQCAEKYSPTTFPASTQEELCKLPSLPWISSPSRDVIPFIFLLILDWERWWNMSANKPSCSVCWCSSSFSWRVVCGRAEKRLLCFAQINAQMSWPIFRIWFILLKGHLRDLQIRFLAESHFDAMPLKVNGKREKHGCGLQLQFVLV